MSQEPKVDATMTALFGDICNELPGEAKNAFLDAAGWLLANWHEFDPKTAASIRLVVTSARVASYLRGAKSRERGNPANTTEERHD